jgi:hypothetical protein
MVTNSGRKPDEKVLTAESVREQANELAEAMRELAKRGQAEAERLFDDAGHMSAEITRAVNEFADKAEGLGEYCRTLQTVSRAVDERPKLPPAPNVPAVPKQLADIVKAADHDDD